MIWSFRAANSPLGDFEPILLFPLAQVKFQHLYLNRTKQDMVFRLVLLEQLLQQTGVYFMMLCALLCFCRKLPNFCELGEFNLEIGD